MYVARLFVNSEHIFKNMNVGLISKGEIVCQVCVPHILCVIFIIIKVGTESMDTY